VLPAKNSHIQLYSIYTNVAVDLRMQKYLCS